MANDHIKNLVNKKYEHGFVTDIDMETMPPGLNEEVVRFISAKKNEPEFLLNWRLKAYEHWLTMKQPDWPHLNIEPIFFLLYFRYLKLN